MQVVAGKWRGLKLITPEGIHTRPTLSRVKEAFFSSIQSDLPNSHFLDMFAGTGQMGIEALSRGATRVVFIDNTTASLINDNLQKIKAQLNYQVLPADATLIQLGESFDYIYIDPPHESIDFFLLLDRIQKTNLLTATGIVIIEQKTNKNLPNYPGYQQVKHKVYGQTMLTYLSSSASQ